MYLGDAGKEYKGSVRPSSGSLIMALHSDTALWVAALEISPAGEAIMAHSVISSVVLSFYFLAA